MSKLAARPSALRQSPRQLLTDRYCCGEDIASFVLPQNLSCDQVFFQFGERATCYGRHSAAVSTLDGTGHPFDLSKHVEIKGSSVHLPFDPSEVVDNLRFERYDSSGANPVAPLVSGVCRPVYYFVRPILGIPARKHLQRLYFRGWREIPFPGWPVDFTVEDILEKLLVLAMTSSKKRRVPFIWFWPDGFQSCTIMTHDVESSRGWKFCPELMNLNDDFGIKSSFQIIPEGRYRVSSTLLDEIRSRGFEINVHDLNHDGRLTNDREEFFRRVERINSYARDYGARGFRSAMMYRNTDWYGALEFDYDMSIPNVGHLDPQRGGCCTVFPYYVDHILELPLTTTQDYTLFHILGDYSLQLWKRQISLILEKHGLISFIVHPDYMLETSARRVCADLVEHLAGLRSRKQTWIALPSAVADWWRQRAQMKIVRSRDTWAIEGKGSERAVLAYAVLEDDSVRYELAAGMSH